MAKEVDHKRVYEDARVAAGASYAAMIPAVEPAPGPSEDEVVRRRTRYAGRMPLNAGNMSAQELGHLIVAIESRLTDLTRGRAVLQAEKVRLSVLYQIVQDAAGERATGRVDQVARMIRQNQEVLAARAALDACTAQLQQVEEDIGQCERHASAVSRLLSTRQNAMRLGGGPET